MGVLLAVVSLACAQSGAARKVAREIVEAFGKEAIEQAEPRVAKLVERYGDDVARALSKSGAPGVALLEKYGAAGVRILSKWGDDGARVLAAEGDAAVRALASWGDDAVEFMIRHPGVGKDFLLHFGGRAVRAPLSTESVVVLNRLADPIRKSGHSARLLDAVERFGDRACAFLWRNKGTIFLSAALVAFLADPQPYVDGVKELLVDPAAGAAGEAVRRANWTVIFLASFLAFGALVTWRLGLWRRKPASGKLLDSPPRAP